MERFNMKTDSHFVSLIIPTIDRETLALTKAALQSQTRPPDELIVVFDEYRQGPGWARNQGFQQAKGDLIALMDDDCVPEKDWLERMISAIDKYDAAMVSSHFIETDPFLNEIRLRRKFPTSNQVNPDGYVGNTGNIVYRRSCLDDCLRRDGFIFNPIFQTYASEDIDLVFRLRHRGYRLLFIDNKVKHLKRMTYVAYMKHQFNRGVGIGILYRLHKKQKGINVPDNSLLWNEKSFDVFKWINIMWKKGLGPFDRSSFLDLKSFFIFWLGEKIQAVGFLYAVVFKFRNIV